MKVKLLILLGLISGLSVFVLGQSGDRNMVSVPVSVSDREGRYIPGMKRDDFTLSEDGVEQKITYFSTYDEPLNIALLLDTSGSTTTSLDKIRSAAKDFVDLLNPQDKCLVVTFDSKVNFLNRFTSEHDDLKKTLDKIATAQQDGTLLRQAVDEVIRNSFSNLEGRNVIVVLSDGKDFGSKMTQVQLAGLLEESDVLIYTIHYKTGMGSEELVVSQTGTVKAVEGKGSKFKAPKPAKKKGYSIMIPGQVDLPAQDEIERREKIISIEAVDTFRELSEITAGRFYVSDAPDLKKIFKTIAGELRQHYWLGYKPTGGSVEAEVRAITVKVEQPDYVVRARGKFRAKQLNQ